MIEVGVQPCSISVTRHASSTRVSPADGKRWQIRKYSISVKLRSPISSPTRSRPRTVMLVWSLVATWVWCLVIAAPRR